MASNFRVQTPVCFKCSEKQDRSHYLNKKELPIWFTKDSPPIPQYDLPHPLLALTLAEKMLIQRVSPFVPLQHIKNGVMGLHGHVCAFEQNITGFLNELPRLKEDVSILRVIKAIKAEIGKDAIVEDRAYSVNRRRVLSALGWLVEHNKEYFHVKIIASNLDWIDGDEGELVTCDLDVNEDQFYTRDDDTPQNADLGPSGINQDEPVVRTMGYVDAGHASTLDQVTVEERNDLRDAVTDCNDPESVTVKWPSISETAVSEYSDRNIFACAFPWLFPGGYGDHNESTSQNDWGKRMLLYRDGRFGKDPVFCFFANNYLVRRLNSKSGRWFVDSFHSNAPRSLEDLKNTVKHGEYSFINNLTYYTRRVKGSSQYWYQKRNELYSWVNHHVEAGRGGPNFFLTLSCAENQWPDIERLIKERLEFANEDPADCSKGKPGYQKYLNAQCVVVQEYFQRRVVIWLKTYGKKILGINHYWIRYEFAPGRGQIHAHILCISGDESLKEMIFIKDRNDSHASKLSEYLIAKHGTTASLPLVDESSSTIKNPASRTFTDAMKAGTTQENDANALLRQCQMHQCSKFCIGKSPRKCKVGCGVEATKGECDTPGFELNKTPIIKKDHKGITKLFLPRNNSRLVQSSSFVLQSWRGNCDLQALLYNCSASNPDVGEIAQVIDYIIAYSCKGNSTLGEELAQTKNLVMGSIDLTGDIQDVTRLCKHVLNKAASSRLISKQEACVMLTSLDFCDATETVENVSLSAGKALTSKGNPSGDDSGKMLTKYAKRLNGKDKNGELYTFLSRLSLCDFTLLVKNVLPTGSKSDLGWILRERDRSKRNESLHQYFLTVKYTSRGKYVIPNFVGCRINPCYPVTPAYARSVMVSHRAWTEFPSLKKDWTDDFHAFINSRYCPKSVLMAYERVMHRYHKKTKHIAPKAATHSPDNAPCQQDQAIMDLFGANASAVDVSEDTHNVKGLPRGVSHDWSKEMVSVTLPLMPDLTPRQIWHVHHKQHGINVRPKSDAHSDARFDAMSNLACSITCTKKI